MSKQADKPYRTPYQQAFDDTLRDMVHDYAKGQVERQRGAVRVEKTDVEHYDRRGQSNYEEVWKADHVAAKRRLTKARKRLELWEGRLKALKQGGS